MPQTLYNFVELSSEQERKLTEQVLQHKDEALLARGDFPLRHADRYRRYLADPTLRPPGPWPESARLFVPTTRDVLERLHAEVWQALFSNMLQVQMKPFGDSEIPGTEIATRFLRWTLEQTIEWEQVTGDLIFDALLDSVGVARIASWEPPWPAPSADARRFLRRQTRIEALDLGMLLVAPDAEGLQYPECRFVHQEFFLSYDDLERLERRGFDVPDYDNMGDSQILTERKRIELEREGERVIEFKPDSIYYIDAYERFTFDKDIGEEDCIVSIFPDAQVFGTSAATESNHGRIAGVRRLTDVFPQDDRPRRPFFPVNFWPQPRQWRGLNIPDRLESMQDMINRLHEQLINYGEVSMLPFVFVNTFLTGEIPDLRTVRPGTTVPIDDISGVQFAPTRSLNRHFAEQIQMMQANVERDSNVTDFNLGRQGGGATAPRTASATMALLAQSRKSFGVLVRRSAVQFSRMLTFHFRLWQEIIPDDTYVSIFDPNEGPTDQVVANRDQYTEESPNLWDRLFNKQVLTDNGRVPDKRRVALPISKEQLSGFFDAKIEVNPEQQFDQQVMSTLYQLTAPSLQLYPVGQRLLLQRIWGAYDQKGFEDIYPEEIALMQTQNVMLAMQVQIATYEGQLRQIQAQEAQQQLAQLQQEAQQFHQTGQVGPNLFELGQHALVPGPGPEQNGTVPPPQGAQ